MNRNLERIQTSPIAVYGIPRSGFSLTIATLFQLGLFDNNEKNLLETLDKDLGKIIYEPITNIIQKNFKKNITLSGEFKSLTGGPKELKDGKLWVRKYIGLGDLGDITLSIKVPTILTCLCPIYHSHTPDKSINERKINIFSFRHPCGIYESSINSFNALTSEYLQNNFFKDEEIIRRSLAIQKICSKSIREAMLNYLSENMHLYYSYCLSNYESIYKISWEGYLHHNEHNIQTFKNIFYKFGINKNNKEIITLINQSKYKNLLQYHKHNYRPGHAIINGWLSELPNQIIKEIQELYSYKEYLKILMEIHKELPKFESESLLESKFKKLATSNLKCNNSFEPNVDSLLKEYALNKTNVDQNSFKDSHIVNKDYGFVFIHRMSKSCAKIEGPIIQFSEKLKQISEALEDKLIFDYTNLYSYYPSLNEPIKLATKIKEICLKI